MQVGPHREQGVSVSSMRFPSMLRDDTLLTLSCEQRDFQSPSPCAQACPENEIEDGDIDPGYGTQIAQVSALDSHVEGEAEQAQTPGAPSAAPQAQALQKKEPGSA